MRVFTVFAVVLAYCVAGCGSDPLKYRLPEKVIGSLPGDKLVDANKLKQEYEQAFLALKQAKLKLKLFEMEMEAAERYAEAAEYDVKATREKLSLQNKGVPVKVEAGALDRKVEEAKLAKKNLQYRKLLYELFEKRVKHKFLVYHQLRADYYEKLVKVLHASGNKKDIEKHKMSDYIGQAADRKKLVALTLEEVEKGQRIIKALEAEVKPNWAPSLSCKPSATPSTPTTPPSGGETKPETKPKNEGTDAGSGSK